MTIDITPVVKIIVQMTPWIIIGVTYGILLGNLRFEMYEKIQRVTEMFFNIEKMNAQMNGLFFERMDKVMMLDRFEIVDMRSKNDRSNS